jgi:hypothetical protein
MDRLDLTQVDWHALEGPYGSGRWAHEALVTLLNPNLDGAQLHEARATLERQLWVEDERFSDISAPAFPFLVRAAQQRNLNARVPLLELALTLVRPACKGSSEPAHLSVQEVESLHFQKQRTWASDVRTALHGELDGLWCLLDDAEWEVRALAALLCAHGFRGHTEHAVRRRRFEQLLGQETEALAKLAVLSALELLMAYECARPFLHDDSAQVRYVAALMALRVDDTRAAACSELATALARPEQISAAFAVARRFRPLDLVGDVTRAGANTATALLPGLLTVLATSGAYAAHLTLAPLLECFFKPRGAATPTREQSAILATVALHPEYFRGVANPLSVLHEHGLPTQRDALLDLAEQGPSDYVELLPAQLLREDPSTGQSHFADID